MKIIGFSLTENEFCKAVNEGRLSLRVVWDSLVNQREPDSYTLIRMIRGEIFSLERLLDMKRLIEQRDPSGKDRDLHFIREEILSVLESPE